MNSSFTSVILVAVLLAMASAVPAPKRLTPEDVMFKAVVARAEKAINDADKNDLFFKKITNVRSVTLTLDSPASKVYDIEFEATHTLASKDSDTNDVVIPPVSLGCRQPAFPATAHTLCLSFVIQNAPVSVCSVKLAFHPWLIHAVPATSVINATCQPKFA